MQVFLRQPDLLPHDLVQVLQLGRQQEEVQGRVFWIPCKQNFTKFKIFNAEKDLITTIKTGTLGLGILLS